MRRADLNADWAALWERLGVEPVPFAPFHDLIGRYSEPLRAYHGIAHLEDCLAHLAPVRTLAIRPDEVEFALWCHDAIYDPRRSDNEQLSSEWARRVATEAGLAADLAERVHGFVMATTHQSAPVDPDARIVCDVDLTILGAEAALFDNYERQIRAEYSWVPEPLFRERRAAILEALIARRAIFSTAHFHERFEAPARENLARSLKALRG